MEAAARRLHRKGEEMGTDSRPTGFWGQEDGATALEYGLILGVASLIALGSFYIFYDELVKLFGAWADWFASPSQNFSR